MKTIFVQIITPFVLTGIIPLIFVLLQIGCKEPYLAFKGIIDDIYIQAMIVGYTISFAIFGMGFFMRLLIDKKK
jgi:hypothetical protein